MTPLTRRDTSALLTVLCMPEDAPLGLTAPAFRAAIAPNDRLQALCAAFLLLQARVRLPAFSR